MESITLKYLFILSLVLFCPFFSTSQSFSNISAGLASMTNGTAVWGDYDNDNDLDLLMVGSGQTKIYTNTAGTFAALAISLPAITDGEASWCDFDNDGDLDFALTGSGFTRIYRNDGAGVFTDIAAGFPGLTLSTLGWADYNNDGLKDLLISGLNSVNEPLAILYQNKGGNLFEDSKIKITPCVEGMLKWGDYNNDGLMDILMLGQDFNGNSNTQIYSNDGKGHFTSVNTGFTGDFRGAVEWGDYDNDGDQDVVFGGQNSGLYLYRNNGDSTFTQMNHFENQFQYCALSWADVNNDGYLDLVSAGYNYSITTTKLYINNKNGTFTTTVHNLPDFNAGSMNWGDFDKDGDLDLVITGSAGSTIYKNNTATTTTAPTVPATPLSKVINNGARLSWNQATDDKTGISGITYKIRVGTSTNDIDKLSPMANLTTGYNLITEFGTSNEYKDIKNLPVGTYYWSVQAIDASGKTSAFSTTQSFQILTPTSLISFPSSTITGQVYAFGDLDNDGDLDIIESGATSTKIFRNDGNFVFTLASTNPFPFVSEGAIVLGDYDNDGLLDVFIAGDNSGTPIAKIYRNKANLSFTLTASFTGANNCSAAWGDYDKDGDLDIIMTGSSKTSIFKNNGAGAFVEINPGIAASNFGSVEFGDYDNDMDLDILICDMYDTHIYKNDGSGNFTQLTTTLGIYGEGSASWGDYDNDGDLDIFIVGSKVNYNSALIYKNKGNDNFELIDAGLRGVSESNGVWGDFNNDGYLDVFYTGRSGVFISKLYNNNGDNTFSDANIGLDADYRSRVYTGDFDNDGDLDFFITKYSSAAVMFRNNMNFPNKPPLPPKQLDFETIGLGGILSWSDGYNAESLDAGLYYNVKMGTTSGGIDVVTPMTIDKDNSLVSFGNAQSSKSFKINTLPKGQYYWSVQAIDQAYKSGIWSTEQTFKVSSLRSNFSVTNACEQTTLFFTDESISLQDPITSWKWDFGDGSGSSEQSPKYTYKGAGNYTVVLEISTGSETDIKTKQIFIKPKAYADFSTSPVCIGSTTSFANQSKTDTLTIKSWLWNFDDNTNSNLQNPPAHGYLLPNTYKVKLTVEAQNGCIDELTKDVIVAEFPSSAISMTGQASPVFCQGGTALLSVPSNSNYSYQWKNNSTDVLDSIRNTFYAKSSGNYSVRMTNNLANCSNITTGYTITVNSKPASHAISAASAVKFCSGGTVTLSVPQVSNINYQWYNSGNIIGTNSNSLTAVTAGIYTLQETNINSCSNVSNNSITVTVDPSPGQPTVNLSGSPTFCSGASLTLSISNLANSTYQWYIDGNIISGANANQYIASLSGNHSIKITDANGCSNNSNGVLVTVNANPNLPVISASSSTVFCTGGSVGLSVPTIAGMNYQWLKDGISLGNGFVSDLMVASSGGDYTLRETNSSGCAALSSNNITVTVNSLPSVPTVSLSGPTTFCKGSTVKLSVPLISGTTYEWLFEGVPIPGEVTNQIIAKDPGNYIASVINSAGCKITSSAIPIDVLAIPDFPVISANSDTAFCIGGSVILTGNIVNNAVSYQWQSKGIDLTNETGLQLDVNSTSTYRLKAIGSNSCYSVSNQIGVFSTSKPDVPSILYSGSPSVCPSDSIKLAVDPNTNYSYQWKKDGINIPEGISNIYYANRSGNYSVLVSNVKCSSISPQQNIGLRAGIAIPEVSLRGPAIWFMALNVTNAIAYKWYFNDVLIPGANKYVYMANQQKGKYYALINDGGECWTKSPVVDIPNDYLTGKFKSFELPESEIQGNIYRIYPNPTKGNPTLLLKNSFTGDMNIVITDLYGKTIKQYHVVKNDVTYSEEMDLNNNIPGVYFVEIRYGKHKEKQKIVVGY